MSLGYILVTAVPTPAGIVTSKYRDGDDSAATPPTTPEIGPPAVVSDTLADVPLVTASTGGTAPIHYELELSTTSEVAGFAVAVADAVFSADGLLRLTGLTPSSGYWVRLACIDSIGRRSSYSSVFAFTTQATAGGDTTAPTAPTNLVATSTVQGRVGLSWTNGTDNVGVTDTDIIRGDGDGSGNPVGTGTIITTLTGSPPATSYVENGLPPGTQKYYRLKHRDAAGNASALTNRVFVTVASDAGAGVALDYDAPFETSFSPLSESKSGTGPIVALDATHAREGTKSLLTHLPTPAAWRAEVTTGWDGAAPMGIPTWIGWSVYFAADWVPVFPTWEVCGQFHTTEAPGVLISPPIAFWTGNATGYAAGNMVLYIRSSSEVPPSLNGVMNKWDLGPMSAMVGQWTDWVIYWVPSITKTGQFRLWRNGIEVVTFLNQPNWVNEPQAGWWKQGIYNGWRYGTSTPGVTERKAWYDCFRQVSNPLATYADVAPRGNRLTAK